MSLVHCIIERINEIAIKYYIFIHGTIFNKIYKKNIYLPCITETLFDNTFVPIADSGVFSKEFSSVDLVTVRSI